MRNVEIGPGSKRIPEFWAVNITLSACTDFVVDVENKNLPLKKYIDTIYSSHF